MKRLIPLAAACLLALVGTAQAHGFPVTIIPPVTYPVPAKQLCAPLHLTATSRAVALDGEACAANLTPNVRVNGIVLTTATLSDHANTATFYGNGSVVQLHQHAGRISARVATVQPRAGVVVWFTPPCGLRKRERQHPALSRSLA